MKCTLLMCVLVVTAVRLDPLDAGALHSGNRVAREISEGND